MSVYCHHILISFSCFLTARSKDSSLNIDTHINFDHLIVKHKSDSLNLNPDFDSNHNADDTNALDLKVKETEDD